MADDPLYMRSLDVVRGCFLENGAVVAADTDSPNYPAQAKGYRFVWPRDAAYSCVCAVKADHPKLAEGFFSWCVNRVLGLNELGVFSENYHTNGQPNTQTGYCQLDQSGSMLWAIHEYIEAGGDSGDAFKLCKILADGLSDLWCGGCFRIPCTDLWEERVAFPDIGQVHTYTLSTCAHGLRCAGEVLGERGYVELAKEMVEVLNDVSLSYFPRTLGQITDTCVDASVLGLVWPHNVLGLEDGRLAESVSVVGERLSDGGGIRRYVGDAYDCYNPDGVTRYAGGGFWPLLSLWMSLVQVELGNVDEARKYFDYVNGLGLDYLPEQVFENDVQRSASPLCWAHSMYVLAYEAFSRL